MCALLQNSLIWVKWKGMYAGILLVKMSNMNVELLTVFKQLHTGMCAVV